MSHIHSTSAAPGSIRATSGRASLLAVVWSALVGWHRRRRAIRRLAALDDHMLKDIGISRSEIDSTVRTGRRGGRGLDFGQLGAGPHG